MRLKDVCTPRSQISQVACVDSIASKLQETLLSKLVTTALVVPAIRLGCQRLYRRTRNKRKEGKFALQKSGLLLLDRTVDGGSGSS